MVRREAVRGGIPPRSFYGLSGLDRVRAIMREEVPRPPVSHLTGWRITQAGAGSATVTMPASPWMRVPDGSLDIPVIIEAALRVAATTGSPPGVIQRTAAMTINHFRPVMGGVEKFIARAKVVNSGRTFTFVDATVEDDSGRSIAHGIASVVGQPLEPPPPAGTEFRPVTLTKSPSPDPWERPLDIDEMRYELFTELDGLEAVRKMADGTSGQTPIYALTGIRLTDVGEGYCAASLQPNEWLSDSTGSVSYGVIASFISAHLAGATLTLSPRGQRIGIIGQTMSLLRQVPVDAGPLLLRANVVSRTAGFYITNVEVIDDDGNHVALGQQTGVLREMMRHAAPIDSRRELTTVLFTDIVESTSAAERIGDDRWQEVIADHNAIVRRELRNFRGREVKTTGDGFLAIFDSPARALHCARAVREAVRPLGIEVRAGAHTGECDIAGDDVAGVAVAIAARIIAAAGPNEILASSTVHDLVAGSGLSFADHGVHSLKGVEGEWRLYTIGR